MQHFQVSITGFTILPAYRSARFSVNSSVGGAIPFARRKRAMTSASSAPWGQPVRLRGGPRRHEGAGHLRAFNVELARVAETPGRLVGAGWRSHKRPLVVGPAHSEPG